MSKQKTNSGLMLSVSFDVLFLSSALVVYLASLLFPNQVVLGTFSISPFWAILHSMLWLTVLNTYMMPLFKLYEEKRGKMLSDKEWMLGYFVLNAGGLWLVSRFADEIGLGLSSWYVVLALALVLDVVQGAAMMGLEKLKNRVSWL